MSPFWILLELRVADVVVTTGAARHAELQSNRHHHLFYRPDALPVAQPALYCNSQSSSQAYKSITKRNAELPSINYCHWLYEAFSELLFLTSIFKVLAIVLPITAGILQSLTPFPQYYRRFYLHSHRDIAIFVPFTVVLP